MDEHGHVYVPKACSEGTSCKLHVALEGCLQDENKIGDQFYTHAGYNEWAEANNIIILYRGSVVEAGSVERVVQDPQHPYTQLLISSIPVPDRKRRWVGEDLPEADAAPARHSIGCKFAPRCKSAMDICWQQPPPLYHTNPDRVAACFLYKDSAVLESTDVAQAFG